jgi:MarR family transcriptional repressor of emrRAB
VTVSRPVRGSTDRRLTNLVGALTLALTDRMREATEGAAGNAAAAPSALVALYEFLGHGSMDQLRRAVGLTPSGAVRLVDRLVQQGYAERQPGSDGRSVALVLTPRGRGAARRVLAARAAALESTLVALSPAERKSLTEISERLLGAVVRQRLADREQGHDPSGGWLCRLCDVDACGRRQGACPAAKSAQGHEQ